MKEAMEDGTSIQIWHIDATTEDWIDIRQMVVGDVIEYYTNGELVGRAAARTRKRLPVNKELECREVRSIV